MLSTPLRNPDVREGEAEGSLQKNSNRREGRSA